MRIRAPGRSVYRQAIPIAADAARGTVGASRDRRRPAYRSQRGRNVLLMFPDASLMQSLKYERVRIARHSLEAS